MGMAASQARFLGLTARQNNVEYEGQQVNQQRTTLANQSANYYNQLLGMSVPVPPSTADYTKTVYTFEDGNLSNSITALIAQPDGKYLVSYVSSWVDEYTPVANGNAIITTNVPDKTEFKYGAVTLREVGSDPSAEFIKNDPYLKTLSEDQLEKLKLEEQEYLKMLEKRYGTGDPQNPSQWYIRYQKNTTTGTFEPIFYNKKVVEDAIYSDKGTSQSNIQEYKMGSAPITEEVKNIEARLEKDATGRYINIVMNPGDPEKQVSYALTTNTVTDQARYEDAMNQYEYDKYQYDQSIQEINAKIEIIQAEDKNLELRLKQLDTEQKAIQSEKEAVEKVVQKNVESTFKTFG